MIVWQLLDRTPSRQDPVARRRNVHQFAVDDNARAPKAYLVQRFSNIVRFACIDRDHYHAYRLQELLEYFMALHIGIFQLAGVGGVLYESRENDRLMGRSTDKFALKSTRYQVLTQTLRVIPLERLMEIEVTLTAGYQIMVNEPIVRGSGSSDAFQNSHVILIKDVRDTTVASRSTYTKTEDFYLQDDAIVWVSGGRAPAVGATYYVTYLYGDPLEFSEQTELI